MSPLSSVRRLCHARQQKLWSSRPRFAPEPQLAKANWADWGQGVKAGSQLALQTLVDYKQLFGSCMLMLPRGPISNNFNSMSKNGTSFFTCHVRFMNCNTFHIVYCMSYVTSSPVPAMLASGFLTPEHPCACCWSRHRHKANTRKRDSLCHNELNHEPTSMAEKHFFSVRNPSQSLWRLENPVAANTTKLTYMT